MKPLRRAPGHGFLAGHPTEGPASWEAPGHSLRRGGAPCSYGSGLEQTTDVTPRVSA